MAGKIDGAGAEIFQPAPLVSQTTYGQPNVNPGFAPYPPVTPTQTPGKTAGVIPGQAVPGIPTK
jgi:hypothetical protein